MKKIDKIIEKDVKSDAAKTHLDPETNSDWIK